MEIKIQNLVCSNDDLFKQVLRLTPAIYNSAETKKGFAKTLIPTPAGGLF